MKDIDNLMFQCPTSSFFLFYNLKAMTKEEVYKNVSMPYFELLPFLQYVAMAVIDKICNVSMPYFELLPFLPHLVVEGL